MTPRPEEWRASRPGCGHLRHPVDVPVVSTLRVVAGGNNNNNNPVHLLMGPVEVGHLDFLPLGPDILATSVVHYAYQLNHSNPLTALLPGGG